MAIKKILPEDAEVFSLQTHPHRYYLSNSSGVQGKINLYARRSEIIKEPTALSFYSGSMFKDQDLNRFLLSGRTATNNTGDMTAYMNAVNSQQSSLRTQQQQDIIRFTPGVSFGPDFLRKGAVTNTLMGSYRTSYPSAHFGYTNYHSLNFFSTEDNAIPSGSVLMYPNPVTTVGNKITGRYIPTGAFSFDFWINPRYPVTNPGTLFHLSSCYAVSLVTGSSVDVNGLPNGFRVLFQASSSADIVPSLLSLGSLPLCSFASEDNSLAKNVWHHVTIRWGTNEYNLGSGSFVINGEQKGTFNIPSASIIPPASFFTGGNPSVLCVGNYYEGKNSLTESLAYFFSTDTATREGLEELIASTGYEPEGIFRFQQPLQAEVHDLKVYGKYLTDTEILRLNSNGPEVNTPGLLFYVPPFFTREAPSRSFYGGSGGVFNTPFFTFDGTTTTPFSAEMSFGMGGHYINLENHTRELIAGVYPRLYQLTASVGNTDSQVPQTCNQLLYATGSVTKRAYTILPCDNGEFYPNFKGFLDPLDKAGFVNDLNNYEPGTISLRNMIPTSSIFNGIQSGTIANSLAGASPDLLQAIPGDTFAVLQRTRDNTSNQVVFFDISNLYYGDNIKPGTFILQDVSLSGSQGKIRLTLKDDGVGNLYRADTTGSHATWASVGNIFYNEGIAIIKDPSLFFFGENQFSVEFSGDRNIHVQRYNLVARPYEHASSSNPSYIPVSASNMANDDDQKFVYVTGVNIHDDNLNVIMKTTLSQPMQLRSGEQMMFKVKMDF